MHRAGIGTSEGIIKDTTNNTGSNADIVRQAAKELGTTPEDLATVISYETEGSFSPKKWGGAGGRYMGLIQFGPEERRQFGVSENQTFAEQMRSAVSYLKTRGYKPGMGITDLYSTINAGSPGHPYARDINGTVQEHVARMQRSEAARVKRFLGSNTESGAPAGYTQVPGKPQGSTVRGIGINGTPYDAQGNYVGYESGADT